MKLGAPWERISVRHFTAAALFPPRLCSPLPRLHSIAPFVSRQGLRPTPTSGREARNRCGFYAHGDIRVVSAEPRAGHWFFISLLVHDDDGFPALGQHLERAYSPPGLLFTSTAHPPNLVKATSLRRRASRGAKPTRSIHSLRARCTLHQQLVDRSRRPSSSFRRPSTEKLTKWILEAHTRKSRTRLGPCSRN